MKAQLVLIALLCIILVTLPQAECGDEVENRNQGQEAPASADKDASKRGDRKRDGKADAKARRGRGSRYQRYQRIRKIMAYIKKHGVCNAHDDCKSYCCSEPFFKNRRGGKGRWGKANKAAHYKKHVGRKDAKGDLTVNFGNQRLLQVQEDKADNKADNKKGDKDDDDDDDDKKVKEEVKEEVKKYQRKWRGRGNGQMRRDRRGNPFMQFKPGTRFCMPTNVCGHELASSWGYGGKNTMKIVAIVLILCLCTTVVSQRCYYQRRMKLLRDALKSDHQVEMANRGPEEYQPQHNDYEMAARGSNVGGTVPVPPGMADNLEIQLDVEDDIDLQKPAEQPAPTAVSANVQKQNQMM